MSFYPSSALKNQLRGTEYGFFLDFRDRDSICASLVSQINGQFSSVLISNTLIRRKLEAIASDMNLILSAAGKLDRVWTKRALADKFSVFQDKESQRTNIARKISGPNLYPERRYWDQEQTLAFCIAARLPYDQAQELLGPMLGQSWLYLRDPYTLVCDFALQTSLSAVQTAELLRDTLTAVDETTVDTPDVCGTEHIRDYYTRIILPMVFSGQADPMDVFRDFIDQEKHNLRGDFSRTSALIRDLIQGRGAPQLGLAPDSDFLPFYLSDSDWLDRNNTLVVNTAYLGRQLTRTFVPWERKGTAPGRFFSTQELLTVSVDPSEYLQRRVRAYLKPAPDYRSIGFTEMRNDLLRVLLMYGTVTTIQDLNTILVNHSFCALNPKLPFDFLVCAALVFGTRPDLNDCANHTDPYAVLADLMAYYRTQAARRTSVTTLGGTAHE